jgi:WS/DGAT/MGAT family acyltransferase
MDHNAFMNATVDMSSLDRAWLLMDRPSHPMMIIGLIALDAPVALAVVRELVERRFLAYQRFRCTPAGNPMGATWVESGQFDINDHLACHALPAPAGRPELEVLVGELASTPFNPGRPLWTFHLVENYRGGCAIIVRIHHSYADGVALVRVLLSLADGDAESGASLRPQNPEVAGARTAAESDGWLPSLIFKTLRDGTQVSEKVVHYALHPVEASAVARGALGLAGELAHLGALADDPPTVLKRPLSGVRRAAWTDNLSLKEVRTIARVLACTINDVLMSALAGGLGRYLESHGDSVAGVTIRAAVPVNLRTGEALQSGLGNRFGLVFVDLPVGIRHPLERLYTLRAAIQKLKSSPQALVTLGLLCVIGNLPAAAADPVISMFSAKASLVGSNLPGPPKPLHVAGAQVSQLLFWVPQAGDIGTGVSMLSYNGRVSIGVISDRQMIPQPAELVEQIEIEFERLVMLVLLGAGSMADPPSEIRRGRASPARRRAAPSHR